MLPYGKAPSFDVPMCSHYLSIPVSYPMAWVKIPNYVGNGAIRPSPQHLDIFYLSRNRYFNLFLLLNCLPLFHHHFNYACFVLCFKVLGMHLASLPNCLTLWTTYGTHIWKTKLASNQTSTESLLTCIDDFRSKHGHHGLGDQLTDSIGRRDLEQVAPVGVALLHLGPTL